MIQTIKQLKKGCGSYNIKNASAYLSEINSTKVYCGSKAIDGQLCEECKLQLQTLKDILKLIDNEIEECKSKCFCKILIKQGLSSQKKCANCHSREHLEEIKLKIQGA